jgi:NADH-quinone oxidoreductase subunit M
MAWLSLLTFLPLVALPGVLLLGERWRRGYSLGVIAAQVVLLLAVLMPQVRSGAVEHPLNWWVQAVNPAQQGFAAIEQHPWLHLSLGSGARLQVDYLLAMDGVSFLLVLLTLIILAAATFASWSVPKSSGAYFALLLLLNTALVGSFLALDLLLFFIFYEFMLLPLYFLIGIWGGERRQYAAVKFFLFTLFGSIFMLLVIVGLFISHYDPLLTFLGGDSTLWAEHQVRQLAMGLQQIRALPAQPVHSLNILTLNSLSLLPGSWLSLPDMRVLAFAVMFVAFAIKLPTVPLHTWLPVAHVEASTPVSVILAGILLKVGGYGLYRFAWGLFPDVAADWALVLASLGAFSVVYGALVAMGQDDLKRMIAYSSVSHMGFVLMGLASGHPLGTQGALLQLFNHGINAAMLFLLVGVLYERVHNRQIDFFRGLRNAMPNYAALTGLAFFASLGLPGLNAFISELLTLAGVFQASAAGRFPLWLPFVGVAGVFLGAAYFLKTYQRMFLGEYEVNGGEAWKQALTDLKPREWAVLVPLALLAVLTGLMPMVLLYWLQSPAG